MLHDLLEALCLEPKMIRNVHKTLLHRLLAPDVNPEDVVKAIVLVSNSTVRIWIIRGSDTFLSPFRSDLNKVRSFRGLLAQLLLLCTDGHSLPSYVERSRTIAEGSLDVQ